MKGFLCKIVILLIVSMTMCNPKDQTYPTKYDSFELERILKNGRLIRSYINCALKKGPCIREAILIREFIPESLENDCAKCTERQRVAAKKIVQYLVANETESFIELMKKYDPERKYIRKYAAEYGIDLSLLAAAQV